MKYKIDDQTLGFLVMFLSNLRENKNNNDEIRSNANRFLGYINSDLVENGTDIDQLLEEML